MSNLPDKPQGLPERPGGRIFHEEEVEQLMTDIYAERIEQQILVNHKFLNRVVASVRTVDHIGWEIRSIVITFTDGTALGITGRDLELRDFLNNPSDEQLFEEASRNE